MKCKLLITILVMLTSLNPVKSEALSNIGDSFICRWTFQNISDFIFNESNAFNPQDIKTGSIIFVDNRFIAEFFEKLHPSIINRYILITHVWDVGSPGKYINYLNDPKIIAWLGIHPTIVNHAKFIPIPLGALQFIPSHEISNMNQFFAKLRNETKKDKLLYMNFCVESNSKKRSPVRQLFIKQPFCFTQNKNLSFREYMAEMAQFKFVLSPPGNALDCYRTWEALLVGCIPIVESSYLNPLYQDLPVLIINNWSEITESFLNTKYAEFAKKNFNYNKLYMRYWIQQITLLKMKLKELALKTKYGMLVK